MCQSARSIVSNTHSMYSVGMSLVEEVAHRIDEDELGDAATAWVVRGVLGAQGQIKARLERVSPQTPRKTLRKTLGIAMVTNRR